MLDPERLAALAATCLRSDDVGRTVRDVRLRYIDYLPARRLSVRAVAVLDGPTTDAADDARDLVATTDTEQPEPALHWYPDDPGLPALAAGPDAIVVAALGDKEPRQWARRWTGQWARKLAREWQRLAWVPARRAVLGSDDLVVKYHRSAADAVAAFERTHDAALAVPTADALHLDVEHAAVVAARIQGRTLERGDALRRVGEVADVLAHLHGTRLNRLAADRLPERGVDDLLSACVHVVGLVTFARPDLARRVDRIVARLAAHAPVGVAKVMTHGDLNVGQLIERTDGSLVVVDTDTLAADAPAIDVAAFATNLISGRAGDLDAAFEVTDALVRARGERPEALDWYLAACVLRRLDRPLRRVKSRWPERVERTLEALETFTAAVAAD